MRHSCDWFGATGVDASVRYRVRGHCGQPFGSSPLGISLRRERCAKKTRRFFLRVVVGVVWASAYGCLLAASKTLERVAYAFVQKFSCCAAPSHWWCSSRIVIARIHSTDTICNAYRHGVH